MAKIDSRSTIFNVLEPWGEVLPKSIPETCFSTFSTAGRYIARLNNPSLFNYPYNTRNKHESAFRVNNLKLQTSQGHRIKR